MDDYGLGWGEQYQIVEPLGVQNDVRNILL